MTAATPEQAMAAPEDKTPAEYQLLGWAATLIACSAPGAELPSEHWREGTRNWQDAYTALVATPAAQQPQPDAALDVAVEALRVIALGVELDAIGKGHPIDPSVTADKALVAIRDLRAAEPKPARDLDDLFAEALVSFTQEPKAASDDALHALAAKWDANAARNQRNGQSLIDQGDEYGNEGLAVAEALGACVVDLRAVLADAPPAEPKAADNSILLSGPRSEGVPAPELADDAFTAWAEASGYGNEFARDMGYRDMRQAFEAGKLAAAQDPAAAMFGPLPGRWSEPHAAPELVAAMRETRELRERMTELAADLDTGALATEPSKKSDIQRDAARRIRKAVAG